MFLGLQGSEESFNDIDVLFIMQPVQYDFEIQVQPTSGPMPRYFRINDIGSELYVVDQTKSTLDLFEINSESGKLTKKQTINSKNSPTFLGILQPSAEQKFNLFVSIFISYQHKKINNITT